MLPRQAAPGYLPPAPAKETLTLMAEIGAGLRIPIIGNESLSPIQRPSIGR